MSSEWEGFVFALENTKNYKKYWRLHRKLITGFFLLPMVLDWGYTMWQNSVNCGAKCVKSGGKLYFTQPRVYLRHM